jgi:hypothetical protein
MKANDWRKKITDKYKASLKEQTSGKLKFSSSVSALKKMVGARQAII